MRNTPRSQWTWRAKASSIEAFLSAALKISRAISRIRRNCWSRSGVKPGIVAIIEKWSASEGGGRQELLHPLFDRSPHLLQSAFEEMISGLDPDKFLWLGKAADERFEPARRRELVARSADEELRLCAVTQKVEVVRAIFNRRGRQTQSNQACHARVVVGGAQANGGSEGKSREDHRQSELVFEPIQAHTNIFD